MQTYPKIIDLGCKDLGFLILSLPKRYTYLLYPKKKKKKRRHLSYIPLSSDSSVVELCYKPTTPLFLLLGGHRFFFSYSGHKGFVLACKQPVKLFPST